MWEKKWCEKKVGNKIKIVEKKKCGWKKNEGVKKQISSKSWKKNIIIIIIVSVTLKSNCL